MQTDIFTRKRIIMAGLSLLGIFTVYWLYSHTFISVVVENVDTSQNVTYKFVNQSNHESTEIISTETQLKRLLPRANYEILVSQDGQSFFKLTKTKSFLGTTTVTMPLSKENSREFVGDEPGFCMYYADILYSYDCANAYSGFRAHVPATAILPTYVNAGEDINATIKGIAPSQGKPYILLEYADSAGIEGVQYELYPVRSDSQLTDALTPRGLAEDSVYSLQPFKSGGLMASNYYDQLKYYATLNGDSVDIPAETPEDEELNPMNISTSGELISTLFSTSSHTDEGLNSTGEAKQQTKPDKGSSEVYIYNTEKLLHHYSFKNNYLGAYVCGPDRLCMYSKARFEIYDTSGDKQKFLFSISDVNAVEPTQNGVLLITSNGVLLFDSSSNSGYMMYTFGEAYTFCGIKAVGGGAALCINNELGESSAIHLTTDRNSDMIDKKVDQLRATDRVTFVSAYKNFIYVTPDGGDLIYSPASGGYIYDPEVLSVANQAIQNAVSELGIDRAKYQIINSLE